MIIWTKVIDQGRRTEAKCATEGKGEELVRGKMAMDGFLQLQKGWGVECRSVRCGVEDRSATRTLNHG